LAALSSLVDKSLLRKARTGRYELLEVLRQYAEEKLEAVPQERDAVYGRHCEYHLGMLEHLEPALKSSGQKAALEELRQEVENIRAAWHWAIAHDRVIEIKNAALSLFLFYDIQSRFQEGAEMFREAAVAFEGRDTGQAETKQALLGLLLVAQGWFLRYSTIKAQATSEHARQILEPLGPRKELALANVLSMLGEWWTSSAEHARRLQESLAIYEASDDRWGVALALDTLSFVLCRKDIIAAEHHAQRAFELRRQLGDRWGMAMSLFALGWIAERQGSMQAALQRYHESLELRRELGEDLDGAIDCLEGMGRVTRRMGDYDQARLWNQESLTLSQEIGNRWRKARSLEGLGLVAYDLEEYTEAKHHLDNALALYEDLDDAYQVALCLIALGDVALSLENRDEARRCYEKALTMEAHHPRALLGMGCLWDAQGDGETAHRYFQQALHHATDWHLDTIALEVMIEIARLWLAGDAPEQGITLLGCVSHHPVCSRKSHVQIERLLAQAADVLPTEVIESALARGESRQFTEIIREIECTMATQDG
jgi:tetratricopeptide (TPR) repeat protein